MHRDSFLGFGCVRLDFAVLPVPPIRTSGVSSIE